MLVSGRVGIIVICPEWLGDCDFSGNGFSRSWVIADLDLYTIPLEVRLPITLVGYFHQQSLKVHEFI